MAQICKSSSAEDICSYEDEFSETKRLQRYFQKLQNMDSMIVQRCQQCKEERVQSIFEDKVETVCPVVAATTAQRYQERLRRIGLDSNTVRKAGLAQKLGAERNSPRSRLYHSKRKNSGKCEKSLIKDNSSPVETLEESIAYAKALSHPNADLNLNQNVDQSIEQTVKQNTTIADMSQEYNLQEINQPDDGGVNSPPGSPPDMVETESAPPKVKPNPAMMSKKAFSKYSRKLLISLHKAVQAGERSGKESPTPAQGVTVITSEPYQSSQVGDTPRLVPLKSISEVSNSLAPVPITDAVVISPRSQQLPLKEGPAQRRVENIDDILFAEWCRLEPEWSSFHIDEAIVKKQIFDNIFQKILAKTVDEYKRTVLSIKQA